MLFWELRWAVAGLLAVVTFGTVGYHVIEGWAWFDALWMVMITLTTIGYGETHPLTDEGRLFTLMVIIAGVSMGTYTIGRTTRYVIEGGLIDDLKARARRRTMDKLTDHFIVVGLGRLGREVVADLAHSGAKIVGIDPRDEQVNDTPGLALGIVGDGSSDQTLHDAHVERARGMAIASGSSATNVFVTLSARQLNPELHILTRAGDEETGRKALRAGADEVISPFGISGTRMAQGLLRPHAANFVDLAIGRSFGDFALEDIRIGSNAEYHGRLDTLNIPQKHKVLIIAIRKVDGNLLTAIERATELAKGDVVVVIGRPAEIGGFASAAGDGESSSAPLRRIRS